MKKAILFLTVIVLSFSANEAMSQTKDVIAKQGSDAKFKIPTEDVAAPKPDASRSVCCLNFDNWTGYTIFVWVDGEYRGTVAGWDDDSVCVTGGWTTWYARTAGGRYSWSNEGTCRGSWNLKIE